MKTSSNTHNQQSDAENQHMELVEICQQIGRIAESNCHYTAGLARSIHAGGKSVEQLTIAELLQLNSDYKETFNRIHGGKL